MSFLPSGIGEIVSWEFPAGTSTTVADLGSALAKAGLDPKHARELCKRHAFVRACRQLAADRLVRDLKEDGKAVSFQFTREFLNSLGRYEYSCAAVASMDKATGVITCDDAGLAASLSLTLMSAIADRQMADITRVLTSICGKKDVDLFPLKRKGGVYFVASAAARFIDQLESVIVAVGGKMDRYPIGLAAPAPASPATSPAVPPPAVPPSVTTVVVDGISDLITAYQAALADLSSPSERVLASRTAELAEIFRKLDTYADLIGVHRTILEDQVAFARKVLADKRAESVAAKAAGLAPKTMPATEPPDVCHTVPAARPQIMWDMQRVG